MARDAGRCRRLTGAHWARDLEVKPKPFTPRPRYSSAGDCLFFYFREDKSWADGVDELLTVYRAFRF